MPLRAVLFDLDGTLLPLDYDAFEPKLFAAYAACFEERWPGEGVVKAVAAALGPMVNNDGARTNEDVFWHHFGALFPARPRDEMWPVFREFYEQRFPKLRGAVVADPSAREAIAACRAAGLRVALATNPVFPRMAIEERTRWAGLDVALFDHVSCFENARFCKPHAGYFAEVAAALGVAPAACLVVGNDTAMDLRPARAAGMRTALVDGPFAVRKGEPFTADHTVPLAGVPALIRALADA